MVKIKLRLVLMSIVIFIFFLSIVHAADSKLIFSDVDVKVGGKTSKNLVDGETIDDEAKPGDTVEFRVEVKNNFPSGSLKIEDISVKVTIEGIDDGDDLEEESSNFNLNANSDKRVTLKFQAPIEVEEDSFDVLIEAEGEDKNGTNHNAEMRLRLDVDKETHKLIITRKSLSPDAVSCNRKNVQLATTAINIGNEDEDDVTFEVLGPGLNLDLKDDVGRLDADPNEDSSRFSKIYSFSVPNDVEAGSYPITLRTLYDQDRKKAEETVTLNVNDCATAKKEQPKEEKKKTTEDQNVEVVTPSTEKTTTVVQPPLPPNTTVTEESFFKSNAFVVGVIIAEIIVVILGIILIVALFARRD